MDASQEVAVALEKWPGLHSQRYYETDAFVPIATLSMRQIHQEREGETVVRQRALR